jgi:hypothetical protein
MREKRVDRKQKDCNMIRQEKLREGKIFRWKYSERKSE